MNRPAASRDPGTNETSKAPGGVAATVAAFCEPHAARMAATPPKRIIRRSIVGRPIVARGTILGRLRALAAGFLPWLESLLRGSLSDQLPRHPSLDRSLAGPQRSVT